MRQRAAALEYEIARAEIRLIEQLGLARDASDITALAGQVAGKRALLQELKDTQQAVARETVGRAECQAVAGHAAALFGVVHALGVTCPTAILPFGGFVSQFMSAVGSRDALTIAAATKQVLDSVRAAVAPEMSPAFEAALYFEVVARLPSPNAAVVASPDAAVPAPAPAPPDNAEVAVRARPAAAADPTREEVDLLFAADDGQAPAGTTARPQTARRATPVEWLVSHPGRWGAIGRLDAVLRARLPTVGLVAAITASPDAWGCGSEARRCCWPTCLITRLTFSLRFCGCCCCPVSGRTCSSPPWAST